MATTPVLGLTQPTVGGDNGVWGGFLDTDIGNIDTYLSVLRQAAKTLTIGATTTLDFNAPASVFLLTVSQATTIAIANTPANITAQQLSTQFALIITNGSAFAVSWPASFVWSGGSPPTLQAAGTDVIIGWSPDNGVHWYVGMLFTPGKAAISKVGQLGNLSTSSGAEVSLGTVTLPASKLGTNGDFLRVTISGRSVVAGANGNTFKFKFGAATITLNPPGGAPFSGGTYPFSIMLSVTRLTATTQRITATMTNFDGNLIASVAGAETLSSPVVLDFRGSGSGADTLNPDAVAVEAATQ